MSGGGSERGERRRREPSREGPGRRPRRRSAAVVGARLQRVEGRAPHGEEARGAGCARAADERDEAGEEGRERCCCCSFVVVSSSPFLFFLFFFAADAALLPNGRKHRPQERGHLHLEVVELEAADEAAQEALVAG